MASHQLAIAKASFSAGLLRPDPTSIARDEITHFHLLLEKAISQCSSTNIQNCKRWLLGNAICSPARISALGKYLAAFSTSFSKQLIGASENTTRPSPKRKRLHILYLLNDLLYHAKFHDGASSAYSSLTAKLQPYLVDLFSAAASFQNCPKHQRKISGLLDLWDANGYYSKDYINKLREAVRIAANAETTSLDTTLEPHDAGVPRASRVVSGKDTPFVMPAMHGELSTPYYDLPAGNLMPHIIPNSVAPINPHLVKPLQFVAGPADERLATAVKDLLRNVGDIFGDRDRLNEGTVRDVDELGLPTLRRDASGELIGADGYYGWSKAFCEKTKDRRKEKKFRGRGRRGRSESRSESLTPRKRRRYSNSDNSRSRSRDRLRSYSRSRSLSNERSRTLYGGSSKNGLPSKARGCSPRSRSPPGRYQRSGSRSRSRSRSLSYSPPPNPQLLHPNNPGVPQPETAQPNQAPPLPLPPPLPYPVQYPQGVSELIPPIPPPHHPLQPFHNQHPMGHSGSWPPPPSPNTNFYQQGVQYPPQQGYPPPPPPWGAQHAFERGGYSGYVYQGSAPSQQQLQHQNSGQGPDDYGRAKEREIGARRGWKT